MMQTRPSNLPPQTIKQAKAEYRKYGPRISTQEARIRERRVELHRRAEEVKEKDKKRKLSLQKKKEREEKEREARRMGIETTKTRIRASQTPMTNFVKVRKPVKNQSVWEEDSGLDDRSLLECVASQSIGAAVSPAVKSPQTFQKSLYAPMSEHATPQTSQDLDADIYFETCSSATSSEQSRPSQPPDLQDIADDFLLSNTQVERDISTPIRTTTRISSSPVDTILSFISTQDVSFSDDEREELGLVPRAKLKQCGQPFADQSQSLQRKTNSQDDKILMPPPPLPRAPTTIANPFENSILANNDHVPSEFDLLLSSQDLLHAIST